MGLGRRIIEARLAAMLLTRLPMGRLRDPVPGLSEAAWAFPLVGVPVGAIGWAAQAGALSLGLPALAAALLAVGAMALATGALHHDGLADFADGIGGGHSRARALEIMRDSRIGSYGTLALILAVGLQAGALAGIAGGAGLAAFVLIGVASRLAMLAALVALPAVRADGLGREAAGIGGSAVLPGAALVTGGALLVGPPALAILPAVAAAAFLIAAQARCRLGGQTGDVLGAVQLVAAVAGWLAASATSGA